MNKLKILVLFLIFLAPITLRAAGDLEGTVVNANTGTSIAGALVQAIRGSNVVGTDITNVNGDYSIPGLQPSNYTVVCSAAGFQTNALGVKVDNNNTTILDFSLTPLGGGTIAGLVTEEANPGIPIIGATVNVYKGINLIATTVTNGSGNYSILDLPADTYVVTASATNFQTKIEGASVTSGTTNTVNFALVIDPGIISGTVIDVNTTNPIQDALVEVFDGPTFIGSALTDVNGDYSIFDLAPGNYRVVADAINFQDQVVGASVASNGTTTVDFALETSPGAIAGVVTEALTGTPIAGATVGVFGGPILIASVLTDTNGNYDFSDLAPGNYNVVATANNFQGIALGASVISNATTTVNFALSLNPGTITGRVTDATNGAPLSGTTISAFKDSVFITFAITDAKGDYILIGLAPGEYSVNADASGYQIASSPATVTSGAAIGINFALNPNPGTITGTVTDATTLNPIPNATILLIQGTTIIESALTDVNGDYFLPNLAPGTYSVLVFATDYQADFKATIATSGNTSVADFALQTNPGSIVGTITNLGTGVPIPGTAVLLFDDSTLIGIGLTDPNGMYFIGSIPSGSYTVTALADHYVSGSQEAIVAVGATTTVNFVLTPIPLAPARIFGAAFYNKFLTEKERVHKINWQASPSLFVTEYHVFRNARLIRTIPASSKLEINDHNRSKNKTDVYRVYAVNLFGQKSDGVSIALP